MSRSRLGTIGKWTLFPGLVWVGSNALDTSGVLDDAFETGGIGPEMTVILRLWGAGGWLGILTGVVACFVGGSLLLKASDPDRKD